MVCYTLIVYTYPLKGALVEGYFTFGVLSMWVDMIALYYEYEIISVLAPHSATTQK
jgi:hypothetical protein